MLDFLRRKKRGNPNNGSGEDLEFTDYTDEVPETEDLTNEIDSLLDETSHFLANRKAEIRQQKEREKKLEQQRKRDEERERERERRAAEQRRAQEQKRSGGCGCL